MSSAIKISTTFLLLCLLTIPYAGHSQTTDTVCPLRKDAIAQLIRIERLKSDSAELKLTKEDLRDQTILVKSKDDVIQRQTDLANTRMFQLDLMKLQVSGAQDRIDLLTKTLRKQKRKTFFTGLAGIVTIGGFAYLLIR